MKKTFSPGWTELRYDFDLVCDRKGTGCVKWDAAPSIFGHEDILPMWVADMDFPAAEPIVEALRERAAHPFYGYTQIEQSAVEAVVERMQLKFNWTIDPEWIVFTPGIVPALHAAVRAFTRPGDEVILQAPVYYPFYPAVTASGCQVAINKLNLAEGSYEMDFADLEGRFHPRSGMRSAPSRARAIILCNPHNPIGRVWTKDELVKMGEIVIKHGAVVISDEIHGELLYPGFRHVSFATISDEFAQNCIVCTSPSKTFNLAGLQISAIIIPNRRLRQEFRNAGAGIMPHPGVFGPIALEAAYRYGDEWLEQVLAYLQGNLELSISFFEKRIRPIKVIRPQGTYLLWLDCRGLGMDALALRKFMREKAMVGFDDGFLFGPGGEGFQRMNIACPRSLLEEALRRIEAAVNALP